MDSFRNGLVTKCRIPKQYWASGLNLLTAAIALWKTVYLDRFIKAWKEQD